MAHDAPPEWLLAMIPLAFLIGFPLLWVAVMFVLSRLSGWNALARRYEAPQPFSGEVVRRCSGTLGWVGYNNSLVLGANEQGLYVAVPRIFAIGHPALLVPWSEIRAARERVLWADTVAFQLGASPSVRLRVHRRFVDRLGTAAQEQLRLEPGAR